MKKLICLAVAIMMLMTAAFAEKGYECEMTENEVLTVRLDANATTGYEWNYEISDESVIDMITNEYTADNTELSGAGGQFVISFKAIDGATGNGNITFKYVSPSDETEKMVVLAVRAEDGQIFLDTSDSYEIDDQSTLTVSFDANATTGYQWSYEMKGDGLLEAISEDYISEETDLMGVGGTYKAVFDSAMENAGMATITFKYAQAWDETQLGRTVEVNVWVTEAGTISIDGVTMR